MHSSRIIHGISYLSWRKRTRTVVVYHGSSRCARQGLYQSQSASKAIFWCVFLTIKSSIIYLFLYYLDTNGAPRSVVNSKGRKRRPGSKTLSQVLRCNDEEFVDFVAKCLVWDPERRMKPQAAMRHPFVTAGRRLKPPSSTTKSTSSLSNLGRNKQVPETPKKSLISAPTPLTARLSRTTTNGGPTTPITQSQPIASGSSHTSRSYRSSQSQSLSNFNSSRTMNGYAVSGILSFPVISPYFPHVSSLVRANDCIFCS